MLSFIQENLKIIFGICKNVRFLAIIIILMVNKGTRLIQTLLMNKLRGLIRYFSSLVNSVIDTSYAFKFLWVMISHKLGMLLSIGFYLILETVVVHVILLNTRQHRRVEWALIGRKCILASERRGRVNIRVLSGSRRGLVNHS